MDLSKGGPSSTGSDVAIVGGPSTIPTNGSSTGYNGGTTGAWKTGVLPVSDPFGTVAVPTSVKLVAPAGGTAGVWVGTGIDGCPDQQFNPVGLSDSHGAAITSSCHELSPGYYPSGLTLPNNYSTIIFKPGIYYLNGSLVAGGSNTLRDTKPAGYLPADRRADVLFLFGIV